MVLERAELVIREGAEEEFAAAMRARGVPILESFEGVRSVSLGRGIEDPRKFLLLVEWDSVEAHTAFSQADVHPKFLEAIVPYSEGGAVEHFRMG